MKIIIPILIIFSLLIVFLIRNFTGMFVGTKSSNIIFEWWNSSYTFRIKINFTSYNVDRINWPIELKLNFTEIINSFGFNGTFDVNSIRVLEYSNEGKVLYLLPHQFDKDENFDAYRNAYGELIFIANGTTYANTSRIFFVYFDILENGKKEKIEFPSNLSYYIQGNLLIINTTAFNYEIELNYSGIVGIRNIFSNSQGYYLVQTSDYPFEYTIIYDEFGAKNSFLFNESLKIVNGPIRIKLIFNGTEFNVDSGIKRELIGNKIYKFYENVGPDINNFGIFKVEQKFINPTSNILNRSSDFVFGFDLYRGIVRTTTYVTDVTGNSEDPYSYGYAVQSIPATTVAIINFNETNTQNFYAYYDNIDTNQRIKINLNSTQINDFISHEAISMISFGLYQGQYDYFYQYLYPAIVNPVSIELYPEYRKVLIGIKTDYNFYNLNETIKIFVYPIDDLYNLTNKIILEIKRGNKVDYIEAFDNGYGCDEKANDKIFSACFLIPKNDFIGIWNITAYAYESTNNQLLATNYTLINVTNKLNVEVYATKKIVEVLKEQEVLINVKNYRNDTYLSNANITCYEDNQKIENYVLIDYLNGSYLFKYNVSIYPGIHTINCSVEWNNNFGSNLDYFEASASKTYLDLVFIPQNYNASKITWHNNESFEIKVIINNTFSGYAYDVNLSVILPNNFEVNSTFEKCDEIKSFGNCIFGFWINVKEKTSPNTYYINFSVKWKNIDKSINETYKLFEVNVLPNSILDVDPKNFSSFVALNISEEIGKITLYSIGNIKVTNISFSHTFDFNLTFYPNITELDAGKSSIVKINASIPFGYKPGYYNGIINVSYNSGYQIVNVTINVLENRSWIVDKTNCSAYFYPPYGKVCDINITNIGNVEINFNVIPINKNYTWIENESFKILPKESFNLSIYYNVTNVPLKYIYEYYNLTSDGIPESLLINITIYPFIGAEGFLEIVPNSSSQNSTLKIYAKVFEKIKVGIEYVKTYIEKPDKSLEEMFLEKIYENNTYSEWYANFSNTSLRGIYNVTLEIKDKAGIFSYNYSYFYIYPSFLTSVNILKKEYIKGQDISITYFAYDFLKNPIENVEVEIIVKSQNFTFYKNVFKNVNGTIEPIITFRSSQDWPEGNYTVIAKSRYFDNFLNNYLYSYSESWFLLKEEVKETIFANLETSVIWYPEGVMKFSITFFDSSGNSIDPDYAELKVLDPAENIYFIANISQFKKEAKGFYVYKYAIPPNTATGAYLAILNFTKGNISSITSKMFRVSAGGPFDLKIKVLKKEVNRGETLPIEVTVINMGEVSMDVFLEYWIVDSNGNRYYYTNEWIYVPSLSQKTFLRELYIFSNQPLGLHYVIASLTYDKVKPPLVVNESFFVIEKIVPKPISIPTAPAPIPIQEIKPLNYSIKIVYIPEEIRIEAGGNRMFTVAVKNFGNANLTKVKLYINGLPFNFYKILQEYELIEPNETKLFDIIINIPKEEKVKEYNFSVLVISKEGAKDEKFSKLVIFESFEKLIEYEVLLIKEKLERLKIEVEIAKKEKRDVSKVELKIKEIEKGIEIVQNLTSRKFYREAYEKIIELRSLIEEAFYLLSIAPKIFSIKEFLVSFFLSNLHYILFAIFSIIGLYLILKIFEKSKMERRIAEKAKKEIYEVIKRREEKVEIDFEKMERERIKKILELIEKDYRSGKIPKEIYEKLKEKYLNKLKNVK